MGAVRTSIIKDHGKMRPLCIFNKVGDIKVSVAHVGVTKTNIKIVSRSNRSNQDIGKVRTIREINKPGPVGLTVTIYPKTERCRWANYKTGSQHMLPAGIVATQ